MKRFYLMLLCLIVFFVSCDLPMNSLGEHGHNGEASDSKDLITKLEILSAFALEKNNITASNAVRSIKTGVHASLNLTEVNIISYDDEVGTFTIEVKGSKNGKDFGGKIFNFSGFIHPYNSMPTEWAGNTDKLKLDEAIDKNYSISKFIEQIEADEDLKSKVFENLSLKLDNRKYISYGKHESEGYELSADLIKLTDSSIKIIPRFKVFYKKLENKQESSAEKKVALASTIKNITCDYFDEKDVYKYLTEKVSAKSFKVDKEKFASYHYAFVKETNKLASTIYASSSEIDDCLERYKQTKGSDNHLSLANITLNYYGNIRADDYAGSLSFDVAVSSNENFTSGSGIFAQKTIELSGFATIKNGKDFDNIFASFTVIKWNSKKDEAWKSYLKTGVDDKIVFQADRQHPFEINVWRKSSSRKFYLDVPKYDLSRKTLKTVSGKEVAIQSITLTKEANEETFTLTVTLEGGKEISVVSNASNLKPRSMNF